LFPQAAVGLLHCMLMVDFAFCSITAGSFFGNALQFSNAVCNSITRRIPFHKQ
jgi:hypothetical protein